MTRPLVRCECRRVLAEDAEPFEGSAAIRIANGMVLDERHGRVGAAGALSWQLLDSLAAGGSTPLYCARCRRNVRVDHDELRRVAADRHARHLTLTPEGAR